MTRMPCEIAPATLPPVAQDMAAAIPVLTTARLTLRTPKIPDFAAYTEIVNSKRGAHLGTSNRSDSWYDFCRMIATWLLHGHSVWTVTSHESDTVLGFVLIGFEPGDEGPELGYVMTAAAEGKGLAFEAAWAARSYGFDILGFDSLLSYVDASNTRSITLTKRLGAVRDGTLVDDGQTVIRFRHLRGGPI